MQHKIPASFVVQCQIEREIIYICCYFDRYVDDHGGERNFKDCIF